MVGSAIERKLRALGYENIITRPRAELDLLDQRRVLEFVADYGVQEVYLAAAKVGGIHANNTYPAEFIYQNLSIECNVIHAAHMAGINKLLFLGSSCIYPKHAQQPMREDALLTGTLEPTNEPYAIAKIAGIKLCESYNRQYGRDYRSVMPTNLYGRNDNFHPLNSHVVPALIRRFHEAKEAHLDHVVVWGTGQARREFLHVDDMADACIYVMELEKELYNAHTQASCSHVNIGTGSDIKIFELATIVAEVVGFEGDILFDRTKPDGAPRKLLDVSLLKTLGWGHRVKLRDGLVDTYQWALESGSLKGRSL